VVYAQLKYMWAQGARESSLAELRQFTVSLTKDFEAESSDHAQRGGLPKQQLNKLSKLFGTVLFQAG
jgi:FKBP12-rapamycin complex-associated protein